MFISHVMLATCTRFAALISELLLIKYKYVVVIALTILDPFMNCNVFYTIQFDFK